mgnify:CR=1 FL=1
MRRRSFRWWVKCVVHNCAVHPFLPAAEAWDMFSRRVRGHTSNSSQIIYEIHDRTVPVGGR